jgi:hypothetical protein
MRILKALVIAAICNAPNVYAAVTVEDLEEAEFLTWDSIGGLQACSMEFPSMEVSQLTTKLDNSLRRLIRVSGFEATNFDEVHPQKIRLSRDVTVSEIRGMAQTKPKSEVMKWCGDKIADAKELLSRQNAKIRSTGKVKNQNTVVADEPKMRTRGFALKLTLLFTNTNATDARNMLKKVPVNQSFESEDECRTYLAWRMTNTEPGILGGAWVPHPTGKQLVCEEQ